WPLMILACGVAWAVQLRINNHTKVKSILKKTTTSYSPYVLHIIKKFSRPYSKITHVLHG
ncbi:MAG TPA: hypothetical protein PKC44_13665, partial [Agitococcus sp.]|nr:hypothetical protein [Agitococcus sp.]